MSRPLSRLAFVVLASSAVLAAGCSSNNKGKIEGKWKIVSIPGLGEAEAKMMESMKIYPYMEFRPDGTLNIGAASSDPDLQAMLEKSPQGKQMNISCKYKLLSGDGVEFYDLPKEMQEKGTFGRNKDRARTKVKIDGDNMTMTDDDGKTGTLTRMK